MGVGGGATGMVEKGMDVGRSSACGGSWWGRGAAGDVGVDGALVVGVGMSRRLATWLMLAL